MSADDDENVLGMTAGGEIDPDDEVDPEIIEPIEPEDETF
jgi:hypothetical protein